MNMRSSGRSRLSRFSALLLASALSFSLIPAYDGGDVLAEQVYSKDQTNTYLGTAVIGSPRAGSDLETEWQGSYLFFGHYDGGQTRYRILDPDTDVYGDKAILVEASGSLFQAKFGQSSTWADSSIRTFLNGEKFLGNREIFTEIEAAAIGESTVSAEGKVELNGDKVFLLDVSELEPEYGYYSGSEADKEPLNRRSESDRFLRTAVEGNVAYIEGATGLIKSASADSEMGIAPAFTILKEKVLLSSVVKESESEYGIAYKLTLIDENSGFSIGEVSLDGSKLTVPYTDAGEAEQISIIITDKEYDDPEAKLISYIFTPVDASGVVSFADFDAPEGEWGTDYHVYAFAEDTHINKYDTDYASKPVEISDPTPEIITPTPTEEVPTPTEDIEPTEVIEPTVSVTPTVTTEPTTEPTLIPTVTTEPEPTEVVPTEVVEPTVTSEPTVTPTVTDIPTVTPTVAAVTEEPENPTPDPMEISKREKMAKINDFVDRIYKYVLVRNAEPDGLKFWSDELYSFRRTGAEVGFQFIFSDEFINRNTTDEVFVAILYKTFFDRDPDQDGFDFWVDSIKKGELDRAAVALGFIYSQEWADTCAKYGIRSGGDIKPAFAIEPTDATFAFVERMYTTAMKRESDPEGKKFWAGELANFRFTGEQVGYQFFISDEMKGFGLDNKEFVSRLYKTFMDREPEMEGYAFWVNYLDKGGAREGAVLGFTRSEEFVNKCVDARILPY